MPTPTYTPLANITLGSSAASVTFSSISQAYRDLVLVASVSSSSATGYMKMRVNSDTGSTYNEVIMSGDGTTARSGSGASGTSFDLQYWGQVSASSRQQMKADFLDYSTTDKHKTILHRGDNSAYATEAMAFRWASTSAITAIQVYTVGFDFAIGSTFALYGVAADRKSVV